MAVVMVAKMRLAEESSARWARRYGRTHSGRAPRWRRFRRQAPEVPFFAVRWEPVPLINRTVARPRPLVNPKEVLHFLSLSASPFFRIQQRFRAPRERRRQVVLGTAGIHHRDTEAQRRTEKPF